MVQRLSSSLVLHEGQTLKDKIDAVDASVASLAGSIAARKKTEVYYAAVSLAIPTTEANLITLLKTLTPSTGQLERFFNTVSNKLNVYNDDASVYIKVNLVGSWTTASTNRGIRITYAGTNGNSLFQGRYAASPADESITIQTTMSVDKNGNLASNGSAMMVQSYGSVFTATSILIVAEQVTKETTITPH
jgi:hypothetical protein